MSTAEKLKNYKNKAFTVSDAQKQGVSPYTLVYLARQGKLKRIVSGLYAFPEYSPTSLNELLLDYLKIIPQAIVGLDSALQIYGLSDQIPDDATFIVPMRNVPKRKLEGVRFFQVGNNFKNIDKRKVDKLPVTTINQTIVDLLRIDRPMAFVIDVFHQAQNHRKLNLSISKIKKLGDIFHTKGRVEQLLEAIG